MMVYFVRHGETGELPNRLLGRTAGIFLSEVGRLQAGHIAEYLCSNPIDAIYSSPLERAVETARPLAAARGVAVQLSPAFHELDYGDWTGRLWEELQDSELWKTFNMNRSVATCPNGERAADLQARTVRELEFLLEIHRMQQISIFTHAEVIRSALAHYAGISLDSSLRWEISPGSITTLDLYPHRARILGVNHAPIRGS